MSNSYYTFSPRFIPGTKVRAQAVNTQFDLLEDAFDLLPASTGSLPLGKATLGVESGSGNAYVVTMPNTRAANANGDEVVFKATHQNSGASTLQVDSIAAVPLVRWDGTALSSGDILVDSYYIARYDSTNIRFLIVAPAQSTTVGTITYATPSGKAKLAASAGTASTVIRSDADIAIDQTIVPTWSGQHTFSSPVLIPNGTAALPGVAFSTNSNTGMYRISANVGGLAANGLFAMFWDSATIGINDGTVGTPGVRFNNDGDTGMYRISANVGGLAANGAFAMFWDSVSIGVNDGTASVPGIRFNNDGNTGFYRAGADDLRASQGGVDSMKMALANPTASIGLAAINGTSLNPMRSDAAPALDQSIAPTWSGAHTFGVSPIVVTTAASDNALRLFAAGAGSNMKNTLVRTNSAGTFTISRATDAAPSTAATNAFQASQTTGAYSSINLGNATDNPTFSFLGTGSVTFGGVFLAPSGSVSAPSHAFSTDATTGMYRVSASLIGFTTGNNLSFEIGTDQALAASGTFSLPGLAFINDPDTGIYRSGTNTMRFSAGGGFAAEVGTQGLGMITGTAGAPGFYVVGDTDTGVYSGSANVVGLSAGGSSFFEADLGSNFAKVGLNSSTEIRINGVTAASATAGAATLPANPVAFLDVTINGTVRKIPYYAT